MKKQRKKENMVVPPCCQVSVSDSVTALMAEQHCNNIVILAKQHDNDDMTILFKRLGAWCNIACGWHHDVVVHAC